MAPRTPFTVERSNWSIEKALSPPAIPATAGQCSLMSERKGQVDLNWNCEHFLAGHTAMPVHGGGVQ